MMSLLSSHILPSRAPLPGKFSCAAATVLPLFPLPHVPVSSRRRRRQSSRPTLLVCRAQNTPDIHRDALVNRCSTITGGDWSIMEDNEHINLKLKVKELTNKDNLSIIPNPEDKSLVIKYKDDGGGGNDKSPATASKLDVALEVPPGFDGDKVKATVLPGGWLQITIVKPKIATNPINIVQ